MASVELVRLQAEKFRLWKQLRNYGEFMRGSMVTLKRPCTYRGCRKCAEGTKHPTTYYSISRKNKTELIYLPKRIQARVKRLIENYHRMNSLTDRISELTLGIVKLQIKERGKK